MSRTVRIKRKTTKKSEMDFVHIITIVLIAETIVLFLQNAARH